MAAKKLNVVLIRPTNYNPGGYVTHDGLVFMPNSTLRHIQTLTPPRLGNCDISVKCIEEHACQNDRYLELLQKRDGAETLVACVGVQSREYPRALDISAYARE